MGSIRNLSSSRLNIHILLSTSSKAEIYVYDILKKKCNASRESIFDVENKSSFENMCELINVQSFLADKWFFVINFSKVKKLLGGKIGIFRGESAEFLIKVKNYSEFKEVKELLDPVSDLYNDIYLSYINFYDMEYILKDYGIPEKLVSFIYKSYSSDPEQIFVLHKELETGLRISSRKQIVDICGVSTGSLNSFAISLMGEEPKGVKGSKIVIKNRIKVAVELAEVYGFGKMRNFLMSVVKDILDIKTLYLEGIIYDRISGIPEFYTKDDEGNKVLVYDEKRLKRYKNFLDTIKGIPYERILRLHLMLKNSGRWYSGADMMNFIYNYYEGGEWV